MISKLLVKTKLYLLNFLQVQLVVTLVSMPILISWGLPFSKMSFVGNLIYFPFLMIFLILSSVVFFTEIISIPNGVFIKALDNLVTFWSKILSLGQKDWLYGFSAKSSFLLILIPLITFIIIFNKKINTLNQRVFSLVVFFVISNLALFSFDFINQKTSLFIENKMLVTKDRNLSLNIDDLGVFNRKKSLDKFVDFTIKPKILQEFGTIKINNLTIKNPGPKSFEGAIHCCKILDIKKVTLPFFNKKLNKYGWKMFFELRNFLKNNNIIFIRCGS